ncbi:MAG: nitrate ABC transporter permease [Patescibacteria group bacterium]
MRKILDIFMPNKTVSHKVMLSIVVVEAMAVLLVWIFSPFAFLPTPVEVFNALGDLWVNQGLAQDLGASLLLNLEALFWSSIISLGLAYLTTLPAVRPIVIAISKGRFLGLVGLTFVFTLMTHSGHSLKVALLVFGMTVFFVTSMASVVASIPKDRFDYARTLRMNEAHIVWEVVVRGTFHEAIESFRQNAAIGWMMLTMVEGISRAEGGLGAMLLNQNKHLNLPAVFAVQILIVFIGLVQDYLIGVGKNLLCPYAALKLDRR